MQYTSVYFTILAALVLPIWAGIWLSAKKKGYTKPVLLGVVTFCVFQIFTRIPILQHVLPDMMWFVIFSRTQPVLYALFLGGSAALFEEGGRYIVMRLFMKNKSRLGDSVVFDGIAFGVGHGGIEAILLVGIPVFVSFISENPLPEPLLMFAGGFERVCTMVVHVAWSVMVLKSVILKKLLWLLLAFLLHTAIDMAVVWMPLAGTSTLATEAVLFVFSLMMLGYILIEYKRLKGAEIQ
jgi:uncharacterized membrane protein YhfC